MLDGLSVRELLFIANFALSSDFFLGENGEERIAGELNSFDLDYVLSLANAAFNEGLLNESAQFLALPDPGDGGGSPSPVPEPSTWAMLLIGFAGLGLVSWRAKTRCAG